MRVIKTNRPKPAPWELYIVWKWYTVFKPQKEGSDFVFVLIHTKTNFVLLFLTFCTTFHASCIFKTIFWGRFLNTTLKIYTLIGRSRGLIGGGGMSTGVNGEYMSPLHIGEDCGEPPPDFFSFWIMFQSGVFFFIIFDNQ